MNLSRCCLVFLIACAGTASALDPSITLDQPRGGWRNSALLEERESDIVAAYPKPPVDRGGQRHRALIEGQLRATGKERPPGRYIVNGIPMPLYTDPQGRFVKPWAFGPGSNSVEVVAPDGARRRLQFYEAHSGKTRAKLRAVLSWDDGKAEVDLHVLTPDGEHAFWAQPLLRHGGGLDVDSVDGGGPEIFSTASPRPGTYLFYINYWGNFDAAGYNFNKNSNEKPLITARLTLVTDENTPDERMETLTVPLRRIGDLIFARAVRIGEKK